MNDPAGFEARLGYRFMDQTLLTRALTHRSFGSDNNERLEYLGDGVLGLVVAEALFAQFPNAPEGDLTRMRAQLVRKETLAAQARALAMEDCLHLGGGVVKTGGGERDAVLADAFEAVVGAIYLDAGLPTVKKVLLALFDEQLATISPRGLKDDKTRLQERLQKRGLPLPEYEVTGQSGKPHALTFTVTCAAGEPPATVTADGDSRRNAEQNAARKMLQLLDDHA